MQHKAGSVGGVPDVRAVVSLRAREDARQLLDRSPPAAAPVAARMLSVSQDLLAGYLASRRSPRTRAAYRSDLAPWAAWCGRAEVEVLATRIHPADVYPRVLAEHGDPTTERVLAPSSIARRSSAVHGFYRYAARHGAVTGSPFTAAARPAVDTESTTSGLTRDEVRALLTAAEHYSPRAHALTTLLGPERAADHRGPRRPPRGLRHRPRPPGAADLPQGRQARQGPADPGHHPGARGDRRRPHHRARVRHRHRAG